MHTERQSKTETKVRRKTVNIHTYNTPSNWRKEERTKLKVSGWVLARTKITKTNNSQPARSAHQQTMVSLLGSMLNTRANTITACANTSLQGFPSKLNLHGQCVHTEPKNLAITLTLYHEQTLVIPSLNHGYQCYTISYASVTISDNSISWWALAMVLLYQHYHS